MISVRAAVVVLVVSFLRAPERSVSWLLIGDVDPGHYLDTGFKFI